MKKSLPWLNLLFFLIFLSGCTNFQFPSSPSTQNKYAASHSNFRPPSNMGSDTNISLNNFSNLNLKDNEGTGGNLWEEIGDGLKIPNAENRPEVQAQIRWFLTHQGYLQRTTERARPYLYMVYQEVKSRHLPTELVLLPINESAYYPFSYSSRGASGIWQLMPGAASDYGLKRDFWYDGRRDIFDSTNAALDYLTYLANYFNGDWLLAIAAYNTGEGNVEHAIERNLRNGEPTDFWSLHLSAQTRAYVPKLLALAVIVAHPERYPVDLPPVDAKPVVAPVHLSQPLNLKDAARFAGISLNQLKVLNPGLSRASTGPSNDSKLLLPINTIENFKANLSTTSAENFKPTTQIDLDQTPLNLKNTNVHTRHTKPKKVSLLPMAKHVIKHRVLKGETLSSIGKHYHVSVSQLQKLNPGVHLLHPGQSVIIEMTNSAVVPPKH